MTVGQLIEELSNFDEDAEVRLAMQPHYPMQHYIGSVVSATDEESRGGPEHTVVYIAESGGNDYLGSAACAELGW